MPSPGEWGGEKHPDDISGEPLSDQSAAQGEDIRVIVLAGIFRSRQIVAQGRPHPGDLVRHHRAADTRPIDHDAEGRVPGSYQVGYFRGVNRIVHGIRGGAPHIVHHDAQLGEDELQRFLESVAAMVGADGYPAAVGRRAPVFKALWNLGAGAGGGPCVHEGDAQVPRQIVGGRRDDGVVPEFRRGASTCGFPDSALADQAGFLHGRPAGERLGGV